MTMTDAAYSLPTSFVCKNGAMVVRGSILAMTVSDILSLTVVMNGLYHQSYPNKH